MKNRNLKLLTGSAVLATLFISGCGGATKSVLTQQPHDTSKLGRKVSIEKDWTWDVGFSADIAGKDSSLQTDFWAGVPDDVENFQTFIDMDSNEVTGYSGSNGWEVSGADYLIENGDLYKSLSHTEWKWKYMGSFEGVNYQRVKGLGKHEQLSLTDAAPVLTNIFTTNNFKVMIEAYDANWEGNFNTITGIVADVTGVEPGGVDLTAVEAKIREQHNSKFTTVTTVDFSPDKKYVVIRTIGKWVKNMLYFAKVSDVLSDIETLTPIAKEYQGKFIYQTNVVKDNGIVEFQIEDDGKRYQVVYDFINGKEISKTLIEGNSENVKKVLIEEKRVSDGGTAITKNDYTIDNNIIIQRSDRDGRVTITEKHMDDNGHVLYKKVTYPGNHIVEINYTYNDKGLLTAEESSDGFKSLYSYDGNSKLIEKTVFDSGALNAIHTFSYDENDNLIKWIVSDAWVKEDNTIGKEQELEEHYEYNDKNQRIHLTGTYNDANDADITYIYNADGKLTEELSNGYDDDGDTHKYTYEYDEDGYLIKKTNDANMDGTIEETYTYKWKNI